MTLFPVSVWLPIVVGDGVAKVDLPETQEVIRITGSLQALTSGTLVMRVRDIAGNLVGTLSWSSAGTRSVQAITFVETTRLDFDITAIGTGADGLYVSVWCNPSVRELAIPDASGILTGLQAFWKMDEASGTRYDAVGSNHLTDNNTVTSAAGKVSDCAQFVVSNQEWLSIVDDASLDVGAEGAHWCCWVYADSLPVQRDVAGKRLTANEWCTSLMGTGAAQFTSWHGGVAKVATSGTGVLTTATWYFLDWWLDLPNSLIGISVNNGAASTTPTGGTAQDSGATRFDIGAIGSGVGSFDGRIDGFGFWNRLLTSDELTTLYNGGNGLAYPFM
jgi:hypothetical protein